MKTPIHDFLNSYESKAPLRLHMPGHKGAFSHDITEIFGADSLYESDGIIAQSENNAAALFGSGKTLYSCGGSTLCIQAMLALVRAQTDKKRIAASRFCHRSVLSAAILCGFEIDWIYPESCLSADISPADVKKAISSETAAVFVTAIDYYGGKCRLAEIKREIGGIPLLADNAHGAYLAFCGEHPNSVADMVCDSAHKTLPVLTGGAYLHINNPVFFPRAKEMTALFGSTSPSYLILESLDLCNRFLAESNTIAKAAENVISLKSTLIKAGFTLSESDEMRVCIDAAAYGYYGTELADEMRAKGAECEFADKKFCVLLFSAVTTASDTDKTAKILSAIPPKKALSIPAPAAIRPEKSLCMREAFFSPTEELPINKAAGRICGGINVPCPPGVPLIMPGETVDESTIQLFEYYGINSISVVK